MMDAGRDLDRLVAEKVMGAVYEPGSGGMSYEPNGFWYLGRYRFDFASLPLYSTQISDAWQVVEYMTDIERHDACTFQMRRITGWDDPTWGYDVLFGQRYNSTHQNERRIWAPAAPHAICLAALCAVGVSEANH